MLAKASIKINGKTVLVTKKIGSFESIGNGCLIKSNGEIRFNVKDIIGDFGTVCVEKELVNTPDATKHYYKTVGPKKFFEHNDTCLIFNEDENILSFNLTNDFSTIGNNKYIDISNAIEIEFTY